LHHPDDFKAGVLEAVNITGDSDSTGSIAGNILGVMNGERAIPEKWRKNLREYDIVSKMADDFHLKFEQDADGHITDEWWEKYPGF
jgi:ADP-ribosylglycohydrolase